MAGRSSIFDRADESKKRKVTVTSTKIETPGFTPQKSFGTAPRVTSTPISAGAPDRFTIGPDSFKTEMSRLENLRRQAAVDLDTDTVNKLDKQMKELRATFGKQTFGDRASDVTSAIFSGTAGQLTNVAGFGAQAYNDPAKYQRDIDRLQGYLDTDRDGNGVPLTKAQRDGLMKSIDELKEKKKKAEAETSAHNRIYKAADQMADESATYQEQAKQGLGAVGSTVVDAATSFGQSALTGAVGAVTGTGMLPFAVTAFGGATQDARRNGADLSQQLMYGAAQAGKEYLTEKLFGLALPQKIAGSAGSFDDVIEKGLRKAIDKYIKTEAGQRVVGGVGTWLLGGATEGLEEMIGSVIENVAINPYLRNFDPDTRTSEEKWAEAWYSALVGGLSGLLGVTNLVSYNPSATQTTKETKTTASPAAAPEVQQAQAQAEVVQAQNPEANVLDAAVTLYTQQGMKLKTAQQKAAVVQKLIAGEEVSAKEINTLEPTSKKAQAIFTQLTGAQFPEGKLSIEQLYNIYRSANAVAVETRARQAEAEAAQKLAFQQAAQEQVDKLQTPTDNVVEQQAVAEDQIPTIEEFEARYRIMRPDATDSEIRDQYSAFRADVEQANSAISLPSGRSLTKDQFKRYMTDWNARSGKQTNDETLEQQFDWFRANAGNAEVAAVLENLVEDMMEVNVNAGEGVSAGDSVRRSGESAGERSEAVPEGRRGAETEDRQRGSTGDTAADSRGERGQPEASARDESQTREAEVKALHDRKPKTRSVKVDGEDISVLQRNELDDGSKRVRAKFAKIGSKVFYTLGDMPVVVKGKKIKGKRAAGIHFKGVTYVQMDNLVSSGEQLGNHEFIHELLMKFPKLRTQMQAAFDSLPDDTQEALYTGYEATYMKTLKGKSQDAIDRIIMDEIFCDAYGNIDRSGLGAPVLHNQIAGIVDPFVEGYAAANTENKQKQISDSTTEARDFALSEEETAQNYKTLGITGQYKNWSDVYSDFLTSEHLMLRQEKFGTTMLYEVSVDGLEISAYTKAEFDLFMENLPALAASTVDYLNQKQKTLNGYLSELGMKKMPHKDWSAFYFDLMLNTGSDAAIKLEYQYKKPSDEHLTYTAKMLTAQGKYHKFGEYYGDGDGFKEFLQELPGYLEIALDNKAILEQENEENFGYPPEDNPFGDPIFKLVDHDTGELYPSGYHFVNTAKQMAVNDGYGPDAVQVEKHSDGALEAFVETAEEGKVHLLTADPYDDPNADFLDPEELDDEWLLDDDMPELSDYNPPEPMYPMNPHHVPDPSLQNNREGFTPTDTPEFKEWFKDDSGWLSLEDGRPKVLTRGTQFVGSTTGRLYTEASSKGTFATDEARIASEYGDGIATSRRSIAEIIGLNEGKRGSDEVMTQYHRTWKDIRSFINSNYHTFDGTGKGEAGLWLTPKRNGVETNLQSADVFELTTNILPEELREGYDSKHMDVTNYGNLKVKGDWRSLAQYPATEEGLDQLNRDLGVFIEDLRLGIPGQYKFYGSATKTLVINCHGDSYGSISNDYLPEVVQSPNRPAWDTNSHINGIAKRAFDNGYDCVVAVNISDAGGEQTQYIFKNPNQIKSVYNKGTWETEDADRNFALSEEDEVLSSRGLRNNYSSWMELYQSIEFSSGVRHNLAMEMDMPAPSWDVNTIGAVGIDGEWIATLGEYPGTKEGLNQLNADLHDLALKAEEISESEVEMFGLTEKEDLGSVEDEDISLNVGLLSNFTSLLTSAREKSANDIDNMNSALQTNRDGFTPTDTKSFKRWFVDNTAEKLLSLANGLPRVFITGDAMSGYTRGRRYGTTNSPGLWHTLLHEVAFRYASGVTSETDNTPMDVLGVNKLRGGKVPELKLQVFKDWRSVADYLRDAFRNEEGGMRIVPVRGGQQTNHQSAEEYVLQTNILPDDMWWGLDANGRLNYDEADTIEDVEVHSNAWRSLAKFPATEAGLKDLNRKLGDHIVNAKAGIRAFSKYYLTMSKPLVIDCQGHSCHHLPNEILPEWARNEDGFMRENDFVRLAFDNTEGYDGVILKNILDEGGLQDQYCVKNPWQRKSVYNIGAWSRKDYDTRYALNEEQQNAFSDMLARIEQEYAEGTAQKLVDMYNARQASVLAAKRMAEANPAVGAAESGFDPYTHMANEYGTIEPGEKPARTIDVPAQTKPNNKVSLTPRTVMEAKATPESRIPTIEDAVVDHKFSYIEGHNKIQVNRAVAKLKKEGWEDTLTNWTRDVRDGKVNADLVAMGAVMLNNAGNSDMSGARYTQLLVDYTNLLRSAGQATQAARILKNLTPEARLYGLQGYANRMNERIRQDNSAHNIPVEKWMEVTGNLLADRLRQAVGGTRKKAKTTAQIILSDLNSFAREAFPQQEKTPGRTEMERLQDLFDNYENYREAWEAAKDTIRTEYADKPEALAAFENFLETDLADAFLGRYFNHPEVRVNSQLAQEFLDAKTDEEREAVIDRIIEDIARQIPATKMEKFTALRYLNMLGNFKTQGRNILGNTTNLLLTGTKNQVATVLELAVNAFGGKVERTKSFTKDKATYQAALNDFAKMQEIVLGGGKYQDGRRFDERIENKRTIFKNKALEGYRKATNWAMTQGDLVFSKIAYADALAGYLNAHGATFESASTELLEQARVYAVRQAAEATFRDNNAFSEAIANMRFKNPDTWAKKALNTLSEGILPFRKTPANILVRAVEYSPVGLVTTAAEAMYGKRTTGTVDGSKVIDSLAKNLTGSMLVALGFALANAGMMRGADSDDDKEKAFDDLTGHQAYSIELPNGMSLTLDWLAPSSIPLFLGVQAAESAAEEGLSFRTVLEALGAVTDPMLQMSMLQGLDDALSNASTYGDDSALVRFTGNAMWSFLTQGLTNTMLGQLERSLKNERSTTYRDKNADLPDGLQYLLGKTAEKLPGVDYGQIPYIDAWGRTEQNAKTDWGNVMNQFINPSYTSWVTESDMEDELRRLYEVTGNSSVLISRPKAYFNVDKVRRDLTGEEYVEYATTRGQTAYNVATDLTESGIYAHLTDKQKAEAVEKAYDFANQLAKATVTGYDPSKWGEGAPEGVVVPDKWVVEAAQDASEYGIPVADYVATYALTKDLESYKDAEGESVDNSKALKIAVAIYDLGLGEAQTKKLLEDFGVNKTVRGYSEKMARRKLDAMREKYE